MEIIGHIHTDFKDKFGIPRQSGLVQELKGTITFEPTYRQPEAFNGLDGYDYIWVLFEFNKSMRDKFYATVKPPRLGGNTPVGVFATRSPFRPNNIGLSSLKLDYIEYDKDQGPILHVSGVDILDGSPIIDIKPYLPYSDSHPESRAGFADSVTDYQLTVNDPDNLLSMIESDKHPAIIGAIAEDPRPGYIDDPDRIYKMAFDKWDIHFTIINKVATIKKVLPLN